MTWKCHYRQDYFTKIIWNSFIHQRNCVKLMRPWFQTLFKLSDGVVENQSCMYTGNEPQPNMKQYCSIKVLEYSIHTADPINNPDKSILQVAKLEVVKTSEVRDSNILPIEKIQTRVLKIKFKNVFSKTVMQKWEIHRHGKMMVNLQ